MNELELQLTRLINKRDDLMFQLENAEECYVNDKEYIKELALMHSSTALKVYYFKKRNNMFKFEELNGNYHG